MTNPAEAPERMRSGAFLQGEPLLDLFRHARTVKTFEKGVPAALPN